MFRKTRETKVSDIFERSGRVSRRAVIVSIISFIITLVLLRLASISWDYQQFFALDAASTQFVSNAIVSVITSIVAAFIFAYAFQVRDNKKLNKLVAIANNEYLQELLQSVDSFNGTYLEDYIANVKLCDHPNPDFITLKINFEYKKYPIRTPLMFTLYRLTNDSDPKDLQFIVQERSVKEFVWQQDERSFPVEIGDDEYSIEGVHVEQAECTVEKVVTGHTITYTCELPHNIDASVPQTVEYEVQLPFENESVLSLTHDFPTLNATINIDYRDVADRIDIYVLTMAGLRDNPLPRPTNAPYIIRYKHRGWLSPQNGYVITWWGKSESEET